MTGSDTNRLRAGATPVLALLFAVYLVLLSWIVLWKLHEPFVGRGDLRGIKLIPFVSGDGFGSSAPGEVLANALLFIPFGVYLATLATNWSWRRVTVAIGGASLMLETAQYVLASGSSDVTDLIVNTAGGLVGIALVAFARRMLAARTAAVVTRVCAVGTVTAVLAVALVIASFARLGPPMQGNPGFSVSCQCEESAAAPAKSPTR